MKKKGKGTRPAPPPRRRSSEGVEVQVKLRCESIECVTEAGLDLQQVTPRHLEDNLVYELPDGKLRKGQYLRIRYTGGAGGRGQRRTGVLTYKGKGKHEAEGRKGKHPAKKVREELETTIERPNKLVKILKRLGLDRSFRYQKYRSVFRVSLDDGRGLLAMFDETPIGNFLELEGDPEVIDAVAARLGFGPDAFLTESYIEMQLARCVARGEPLSDMVFPSRKIAPPKKRRRSPS